MWYCLGFLKVSGHEEKSWQRGPLLPALLFALTGLPLALGVDSPLRLAWPPLLALALVFLTHRAALGLFLAGLAGCLLLAHGHPVEAARLWLSDHAWPTLFGSWTPDASLSLLPKQWHLWHLGALLFTLLLGALAAVLERGGGLLHILRRDSEPGPIAQKRFLTSVFGLGLLCFFDGLANSLMVGRVARGISDRLRIPRAALAYLVDTTSSAVACVAFLSTWIAVQLSLIQDGIAELPLDTPAYLLFLSSIPHNYYCLFALALAFLTIRRAWWIGPMAKAPLADDAAPFSEAPPTSALSRALIPIAVLALSIVLFYYFLHPFYPPSEGSLPPRFPITLDAIQAALGSNAGPAAFVLGSALALLCAALLFPKARRAELPTTMREGTFQLLPSLLVLLMAWIFGSVIKAQGTADLLANSLGSHVPLSLFPAAVFLAACLTSFVSGTSWGTMALLMPLALPVLGPMAEAQEIAPAALATLVPSVIAAVFGGAVFGDHCSPFSDTTIVSALACGISTPQHTLTQLPYALLTAAVALVLGYGLESVGLAPWLTLTIGLAALVGITSLQPRKRPAP